MKTDPCRSCKAPVIWTVTENDRAMPVDAEPSPDGTIMIEQREGAPPLARVVGKGQPALPGIQAPPLHLSHFATCPHAAQHRRGR